MGVDGAGEQHRDGHPFSVGGGFRGEKLVGVLVVVVSSERPGGARHDDPVGQRLVQCRSGANCEAVGAANNLTGAFGADQFHAERASRCGAAGPERRERRRHVIAGASGRVLMPKAHGAAYQV